MTWAFGRSMLVREQRATREEITMEHEEPAPLRVLLAAELQGTPSAGCSDRERPCLEYGSTRVAYQLRLCTAGDCHALETYTGPIERAGALPVRSARPGPATGGHGRRR